MWRRRLPRARLRRPRQLRPSVPPLVRRALARAQRLRAQGDFLAAAAIYDRLAQEALARDRQRPGLQMTLAAARSYLRGAAWDEALKRARQATEQARGLGRPALVAPLARQMVRYLDEHGEPERAKRFRAEMEDILGQRVAGAPELEEAAIAARRLPANCPACRAPLYPEEVTWLAADRATCPFCGSVVMAESPL